MYTNFRFRRAEDIPSGTSHVTHSRSFFCQDIRGSRIAWKIFETLASSPSSSISSSPISPSPSPSSLLSSSAPVLALGVLFGQTYFNHQLTLFLYFLIYLSYPRCKELFPPGHLSFPPLLSALPSTDPLASTSSSNGLPTRYVLSDTDFPKPPDSSRTVFLPITRMLMRCRSSNSASKPVPSSLRVLTLLLRLLLPLLVPRVAMS